MRIPSIQPGFGSSSALSTILGRTMHAGRRRRRRSGEGEGEGEAEAEGDGERKLSDVDVGDDVVVW
jgi:hypothetical protein